MRLLKALFLLIAFTSTYLHSENFWDDDYAKVIPVAAAISGFVFADAYTNMLEQDLGKLPFCFMDPFRRTISVGCALDVILMPFGLSSIAKIGIKYSTLAAGCIVGSTLYGLSSNMGCFVLGIGLYSLNHALMSYL